MNEEYYLICAVHPKFKNRLVLFSGVRMSSTGFGLIHTMDLVDVIAFPAKEVAEAYVKAVKAKCPNIDLSDHVIKSFEEVIALHKEEPVLV